MILFTKASPMQTKTTTKTPQLLDKSLIRYFYSPVHFSPHISTFIKEYRYLNLAMVELAAHLQQKS